MFWLESCVHVVLSLEERPSKPVLIHLREIEAQQTYARYSDSDMFCCCCSNPTDGRARP